MLKLKIKKNKLNFYKFVKKHDKDLAVKKLRDNLLTNPDVIKKQSERSKKQWKSISNEVTEIARRRMIQNNVKTNFKDSLKLHFAFKDNNYTIVKLTDRYVDKFKTREARWKIEGDVDLFSINKVLRELIAKMTENVNQNSKVQISMTDKDSNRYYQTEFLSVDDL